MNWKCLSNWDYSYSPATYASFYLTDTEMSEYKEMLILYDTDTIASCKTKIVYKIEIDTRGGAYWHQTPSMEQAILTKNGNLIEIKAGLGSKPLYFVAIYWR